MTEPIVVRGDARALPLPDESVHAIVCDPPYELAFMSRTWDSTGVAFDTGPWREALRVLKPGGHMAVFGAPRTYHRVACAIEDAGFETRDSIMAWTFGSGFPKSLDVGKAIDKARGDEADWKPVGQWLRAQRSAAGHTRQSLAPLLSGHRNLDSAAANVSNWENGLGFPTWERWEELRGLLGFGDDMDAEVLRLNGRKGTWGNKRADRVTSGFDRGVYSAAQDVEHAGTPVLDAARAWSGWGTALKPAHEPIICARKPLSPVPSWDEVRTAHHALGGLLWLSCSTAKRAELSSPSSPHALPAGTCASALASAATASSPDASVGTATYSSPELASTCSSIASSWNAILAALSEPTRTFTTSTASSTTTALRTLNSLLAPITSLTTMPPCECLRGGAPSSAESAGGSSSDAWARWRGTLNASAPASAIEPIATAALSMLAHVAAELSVEPDGKPSTAPSSAPTDQATTSGAAPAEYRPAHEPILLARKPLSGNVAANTLAHGCGGLHVDACRVESDDAPEGRLRHGGGSAVSGSMSGPLNPDVRPASPAGRWPTNVVLAHAPELDPVTGEVVGDACADGCVPGCHVRVLDEQSGVTTSAAPSERSGLGGRRGGIMGAPVERTGARIGHDDSGGASRFYPTFRYEAKAPAWQRPQVNGRGFETVKPLDLMRWLVRLLTPPGGLVLDMFPGTGTTGQAAQLEGFRSVLVELEAAHLPFIRERLAQPVVVDRKTDEAVPVTPAPDDALSLFELGDAS